MPQTQPDVPAPPAPPAPPALPVFSGQRVITASDLARAAANPEQVKGLRARREMLSDQLEQATDRRDALVRELERLPASAREGVQQRIQQLDQRILQLDQDIAQTGRALAATPPELLAQTVEEPRGPDMSNYVAEDEAMGIAFATFGAGVLLTLLVGRVRGWRRRRRMGKEPVPAVRFDDPRIDRLAQALDAVAVEVERIGEGQRFVTQLLAESRPGRALAGVETTAVESAGR